MEYEFKNKEMVTNKKESRNFILKKWLEFKAKRDSKTLENVEKNKEILKKENETKENI